MALSAHNMGCKGLDAGGVDLKWQLNNPVHTKNLQIDQMHAAASLLRERFEEAGITNERYSFRGVYRTGRKPSNQAIKFKISEVKHL